MGWTETPWIKLQLSEIDTKGVLIILNEVSSTSNCDSPSVMKTLKGKRKWMVRTQTCIQGAGYCEERWEIQVSAQLMTGKEFELTDQDRDHPPRAAVLASPALCFTAWRLRSWASSRRTDSSVNLIWTWSLKTHFHFLLTRWPLWLWDTCEGKYLRVVLLAECEKWMQCTVEGGSLLPKFKGDCSGWRSATVDVTEMITISAFLQAAS